MSALSPLFSLPALSTLLAEVRTCTLCAAHLPHGSRPVVQMSASARILIVSQAPGRRVHETGGPFNDASGDRLRQWLGMTRAQFYDAQQMAILPMGFCYPGTGKAGDLPPRPQCAAAWRAPLLAHLKQVQLTLVIGQYAHAYHWPSAGHTLTATMMQWRTYWPQVVPMPHPRPRNNVWLARHPWFEAEVIPALQERVRQWLAHE